MAAALSRDSVEQALLSKLKMEPDIRNHRWYSFVVDGKTVVRTFVSTGGKYKTLGDDLVSSMAKQLRVPSGFLRQLAGCTKDIDDYRALLREQGHIQ